MFEHAFRYDLSEAAELRALVEEARSRVDRSFEATTTGYKRYLNLEIPNLSGKVWAEVKHAQELRNALVHNLGTYTSRYLLCSGAVRAELPNAFPTGRQMTDAELINRELIPLSEELVRRLITSLIKSSAAVSKALRDRAEREKF